MQFITSKQINNNFLQQSIPSYKKEGMHILPYMYFLIMIHAYNNIFAFTSFGVNLDKELASAKKKGVYTCRAQGQIYHDLPLLLPRDNNPCYFQLYFFDTDNELTNRLSKVNEGILSDHIATKIKQVMESNPYAQIFCQLKIKQVSTIFNFVLLQMPLWINEWTIDPR